MMRKIGGKVIKYGVARIALKMPGSSHHTEGIKALIHSIKDYCSSEDLQLHSCAIADIKAHYSIDVRKSKRLLIELLGNKHPLLYYRAQRELVSRNSHYTRMFEAVAAVELSRGLPELSAME